MRIKRKGLKIAALKIIKPTKEIGEEHYIEHKDKSFFKDLIKYLIREDVGALIIEGDNVFKMVRKTNGATNPVEASVQ